MASKISIWMVSLALMGGLPWAGARAGVFYDTTGGGGNASTALPLQGNSPEADSFMSLTATVLSSVTLDLIGSNDTNKFRINLASNIILNGNYYPNTSGMTFLGVVVDNSLTAIGSVVPVTINLVTPISIAANTRYWIVVNGSSTGSWVEEQNFVWTGSVDVAAEFVAAAGSSTLNSSSATPFQMALNSSPADPVPEPSSLSMLLLPVLFLAAAISFRAKRVGTIRI